MSLPSNNFSEWTSAERPEIIFYKLPEDMPLMLGWPDAAGENITDKVQYEKLGDIELVGATQGYELYKIEFIQRDANAYVIFNGIGS
jgi:hypothetical protein